MTDFELRVNTDVLCRACERVVATLHGTRADYESVIKQVKEVHRANCPARGWG